jgi:hypothetical protein
MLSPPLSRFAFGCNYIVTQEGAVCNMGVSSSVNDSFGSYAADFGGPYSAECVEGGGGPARHSPIPLRADIKAHKFYKEMANLG